MLKPNDIVLVFLNTNYANDKRVAILGRILAVPGDGNPFIVYLNGDGRVTYQNPYSFNLDFIQPYSESDASKNKQDAEYQKMKHLKCDWEG